MKANKEYIKIIKEYILDNYQKRMQKPIEGKIRYPYFTSGIDYVTQVWDWGSWLASISMRSIKTKQLEECQKGIIYNFLDNMRDNGYMPTIFSSVPNTWCDEYLNGFKPVFAQHILEISNKYNDFEWVKLIFDKVSKYFSYYDNNLKDEESGLYFWADDFAIGTDNDPTVFYRPNKSTAHILLNCLMYKDLCAMSELASKIGKEDVSKDFLLKSNSLKQSIQKECYDPIDGYFYSADLTLRKVNTDEFLHQNFPRFWHSLPMKITTWAGMMALWANVASKEQADKCVKRYLNKEGLYSNFGIRSLAKNEKMYAEVDTCNPSCWLGPVWVNANYFTYIGLRNYGYRKLAKEMAIKTINMLGKSLKEDGGFYEYYDSNTGKGIRGVGMHGWNFLVSLMIDDLENNNI